MKTVRMLLVAIMVVFTINSASAQGKINAVIHEIENLENADIVYSEKRGPESKKIYKITKVIKFKDKALAEKLIDAMKTERTNAVSYEIVNRQRIYKIKFLKENNIDSLEISLIRRDGGWTISFVKQGHMACDGSYPDWE